MEQGSEKDEETKTKPIEEEVSSEAIMRGETLDKFIDKDSPFRRTKQQITNEPTPDLPDYIKQRYPYIKKKLKREIEVGQFKKFMKMLTVLQVNIMFCDAQEQIPVYAKFMKELLNGEASRNIPERIACLNIQ